MNEYWGLVAYNLGVIGLAGFCVAYTGTLWGLLALLFVATKSKEIDDGSTE